MKLKEWMPEWFEHYIKPAAKERTILRYGDIINHRLIPNLGNYELDQLTPIVIQRYITELIKGGNLKTGKGLSSNTINIIITVLQGGLYQAHILGYLPEYTGGKIKRPKVREKQVTCFSIDEQEKIEKAIMSDKRVKMFGVILCLYTGLRIGELLALEWSDIDFQKGEIYVSKSCHDSKKDGKYCRLIDVPKTEHFRRIVPLPKQLIPMLREVKRKNNSQWVVGNGDKVISVRSYQYSFSLLLDKLNIDHKGFHSLRHTFATRAIECGIDVKTLSEILGHKNATVTLERYAHSMLSHKHEMMNRLGKMLQNH